MDAFDDSKNKEKDNNSYQLKSPLETFHFLWRIFSFWVHCNEIIGTN